MVACIIISQRTKSADKIRFVCVYTRLTVANLNDLRKNFAIIHNSKIKRIKLCLPSV